MKTSLKLILINLTLTQLWLITLSYSQTPIIDKLYNDSEIIVQGTIKGKECIQQEIGVVFCIYAIQVDSIYKGIPDIYEVEGGEFLQAGQSMTIEEIERKYRITYFSKHCLNYLKLKLGKKEQFQDQCLNVGENMIVFLNDHEINVKEAKKINTESRYNYGMTDQWLGAMPANSYISEYFQQRVRDKQ